MSWQHLRSYKDRYWLVTAHSWWLYSAAPLRNQVIRTMTWYPIVILSWQWVNQSLPHSNNAERLAMKPGVHIIYKYTLFIFYSANSTIHQLVIKDCFTYNNWYRQVKLQHIHIYTIMVCHLNQCHHATQSWHWANQSLPYPNNAKHLLGSDKYKF